MSIFNNPCYPWEFPFPGANALAVPQLAEKIHRNMSAIVAASGTDGARSAATAAIRKAKEAGSLSESDVQRLTAVVSTDSYDARKLYLESLDDPTASEFAGMLLGVIQLPRDRGTGSASAYGTESGSGSGSASAASASTDSPHGHTFSDLDLIALGLMAGPIAAVAVGIVMASEHVSFPSG